MRNIQKSFGATQALTGVDLSVRGGEVLALVGENGAGKSTLMKLLSGACQTDAGEMWLDGQPYQPRDPRDARRAGVAIVYQELAQCPHLSVAENILLGREPTLGPLVRRAQVRQIATQALSQVGRPDISPDVTLGQLSIADRQLVEIARAVADECKVLVLDEPTSSLAAADVRRLFSLIQNLRSKGYAIIYISHFLEEVRELSDRYVVLRDGRAVGEGRTAEVTEAHLIALMVGRQMEEIYARGPREVGDIVLEVKDLSGRGTKLAGASLELHRGEVLGIAGLVGSGRTEFLRAIFGLDHAMGGKTRFSGRAGLLSEDRKAEGLAVRLSIADNVTLASLPPITTPGRRRAETRRWIDYLSIRCRQADQPVGDLSGGNQQKVALARLLHDGVDVFLLDEPTRGIDVGSKAQIYRTIDELARGGKAVLMVSSYLPELLGVCDRIAVMCRGRLGPALAVNETDEHRIMQEAIGSGGLL
jgi:ribose transport system ATP-binding protein